VIARRSGQKADSRGQILRQTLINQISVRAEKNSSDSAARLARAEAGVKRANMGLTPGVRTADRRWKILLTLAMRMK
tara:strand:+ start:236 stop:466 length:231 start_codon:yes stop_codon:yes gene_type:complete